MNNKIEGRLPFRNIRVRPLLHLAGWVGEFGLQVEWSGRKMGGRRVVESVGCCRRSGVGWEVGWVGAVGWGGVPMTG